MKKQRENRKKMYRKIQAVIIAALFGVCCLSGCGQDKAEQTSAALQEENVNSVEESASPVEENQIEDSAEEQQKKSDAAILVVSFGTSYNDNREITIGAIEDAIAGAYPEYEVRRAFTSQIIIDKLKERDGLEIDNVEEALDEAAADGIKELIVQPTHLMDGYEYNDLAKALTEYKDKFDRIIFADPLLTSDSDFEAVMKAITEKTAAYDDGETAICFMGHGTGAASNGVYAKLQEMLTESGYENYYIGTVEAYPTLDEVIKALKEKGSYKKVVLEPLMVVAGDHANNDMAGDEEDSWKTVLEGEGYEVECILEGLGQIPAIQEIYVAHIREAMEKGTVFDGVKEEAAGFVVTDLADGVYHIEVESSSSMFNIEKAELTVAGGSMTAVITLGGTGYSKLYMGTAEQAAEAEDTDCIPFVEDAQGAYTYTIPVTALDWPMDCAAFSKKKEEWYDRQITFRSASLSSNDTAEEKERATRKTAVEEGTYVIEVTLGGGSGKTTIVSPVTVAVTGETAVATIQWSSPNYDYMVVDEKKYFPVNTEGNSVFEIPVLVFDEEMTVIGDTVAMSKPHEIEYTLTFHSDTMKAVEAAE